ncbi:MAG: EAL domain-containing protein [Gorillibacterium sp.]|nr:EAL domain-containing protein [Gorillibacterium sp.]
MHEVHRINVKRYMVILLLLLSVQFLLPSIARSEEQSDKRILILNSYHKGFTWTDNQTDGIEEAIKSSGAPFIVYTEYMDWKRSPTEESKSLVYQTLKINYAKKKIDLVITTDDAALQFALLHRAELLGNAPIVFSGVNQSGVENIVGNEHNITGVIEEIDPTETIQMALQINPFLKYVYVLFDRSESGVSTGKLVMEKLQDSLPELSGIPMDNLTFDQLKKKVAGLRGDSILLMTTYHSDINGNSIETERFTNELSQASTVPLYHLYDFGLNQGAFGGNMISGRLQGENAAGLALKILAGKNPDELPVITDRTSRNVFDYKQLARFKIQSKLLPPGSEVINKPFSFYDTYRTLVLMVAGIFVLLIVLISVMLYYIRLVRKTKLSLALMNVRYELATSGSDAVIWDLDMVTIKYFFSERWYQLLGYKEDEVGEKDGSWVALIHQDDVDETEKRRRMHMAGETDYFNCDFRILTKSGVYKWFQVRGKVRKDATGRNIRFAGSMLDITEQKEDAVKLQNSYQELEITYEELTAMQEELMEQYDRLVDSQEAIARSEERYRLVTEATNDGIWEEDHRTNEAFYSERWYELMEMERDEAKQNPFLIEMIHPDDQELFNQKLNEHIADQTDHYQIEYRLRLGSGEYKWFQGKGKALFDEAGEIYRIAGSNTDIDTLKKSQQSLHELAYYDSLSNLPNKQSLKIELNRSFEMDPFAKAALFFLDIDNFKYINDTMGHKLGDKLLALVGERLVTLSGENTQHFRMGGDEFIVLLQNVKSWDDVVEYAEHLLHCFREPFYLNDSSVHLSASIGVAQYPADGRNTDELLKNADVAMYKAKESRKGSFVIYDESLQRSFDKRMNVEKHLRTAISNQELSISYQPQIKLNSGEVWGFEALIRWSSPVLGFQSPLSFIKIAEDCRLIIPIGEWILRSACSFIKEIHQQGHPDYHISVNISVVQLMQDDFIAMIMLVLKDTDLHPGLLELEITESILVDSFEEIIGKLSLLKAKGIHIALDDFGTGYSSLSYLKQLPITTLKVDKSFIDNIPDNASDVLLAESIITIGHQMGLTVVAEGVETAEQLLFLEKAQCDKIQGYYISKPIPQEEVQAWIEKVTEYGVYPQEG